MTAKLKNSKKTRKYFWIALLAIILLVILFNAQPIFEGLRDGFRAFGG